MRYIKNISDENIEGVEFEGEKFDLPAGDVNALEDKVAEFALEEFKEKVIEVDEKGEELKKRASKPQAEKKGRPKKK